MVDPRNGEEFHTGVLFDADLMFFNHTGWRDFVDPVRPNGAASAFAREEAQYGAGMSMEAAYGRVALSMLGRTARYDRTSSTTISSYRSPCTNRPRHGAATQLHRFGGVHGEGAPEQRIHVRNGAATSVMEYSPINSGRTARRRRLFQIRLGPYDYYAIHYGYGRDPDAIIAGSRIADAEHLGERLGGSALSLSLG